MVSQKRRLETGEMIFCEGDLGDHAYIIESGAVEIFISNGSSDVNLTYLGVGEIFGEMSVIDNSPRSASARATEPCELVVVSAEAISERIDSVDPIVRLLITMLLDRMRKANQSVSGELLASSSRAQFEVISSSQTPEQLENVLEKMKIESELKQALLSNEFALHFQPIMDLQSREVSGFEALIRWYSPTRGLVRPDIFMGIAEETSLIIPIGKWVFEKSIAALKEFNARREETNPGAKELFMSINISGRQFHDQYFFEHLAEVMENSGVSTSQVKLEVTERIFMEGYSAIQAIQKCREMGFHIALDDFGTGYSSLSYLAQFQVDSLKVDQSFIRSMLNDQKTFVITSAIISMANGLGIPVIAEGIEVEREHDLLMRLDCQYAQGYLFSKPVPLGDAINFLHKSSSDSLVGDAS